MKMKPAQLKQGSTDCKQTLKALRSNKYTSYTRKYQTS